MGNTTTRGVRNFNPLNIRHSASKWVGMAAQQTDRQFVQFRNMPYGFRAAFRLLRTYMVKYGLCHIEQIISRWAPPNENNTEAYISTVCRTSGLRRDALIRFTDKEQMLALVQAMAYVENGVIFSKTKSMAQGYDMARQG